MPFGPPPEGDGIDGAPALGEDAPLLPELLRELLFEDELLDVGLLREEELLEEELLDGMELLLVGICAEGGWLLLDVVLQPATSTDIRTGRSRPGGGSFTADTCTSK